MSGICGSSRYYDSNNFSSLIFKLDHQQSEQSGILVLNWLKTFNLNFYDIISFQEFDSTMDYSTKELEGSQTMNYEIIMFVKNRSGNLAI